MDDDLRWREDFRADLRGIEEVVVAMLRTLHDAAPDQLAEALRGIDLRSDVVPYDFQRKAAETRNRLLDAADLDEFKS